MAQFDNKFELSGHKWHFIPLVKEHLIGEQDKDSRDRIKASVQQVMLKAIKNSWNSYMSRRRLDNLWTVFLGSLDE